MSAYPDGVPGEKALRGLLGGAALAYWSAVASEREDEFNRWYTHQHLPERVGIPGFLRGRRYVEDGAGAAAGRRTYFTLYETETLATLTSPAYMKRLDNPSDWSRRVLPWFARADRTACSVTRSLGAGVGGWAAVVGLGPATEGGELRGWLADGALPALLEAPLVVGAHLLEADAASTGAKAASAESGELGPEQSSVRWLVLVEAAAAGALDVTRRVLRPDAVRTRGGAGDVRFERYRLLFCLSG